MEMRIAEPGDAAAIAGIYAPYVSGTVATYELEPPSAGEMAARMRDIAHDFPYLVCLLDGDVAGYAYAHRFRERKAYQWNAELTVYVKPGLGGRNIGSALYHATIALLKRQKYRIVYGCIGLPNPGSIGLHERFGFHRIGVFEKAGFKFDQWRDMVWYGKNILPFSEHPEEPVAFADLDPNAVRDILVESARLAREGLAR